MSLTLGKAGAPCYETKYYAKSRPFSIGALEKARVERPRGRPVCGYAVKMHAWYIHNALSVHKGSMHRSERLG